MKARILLLLSVLLLVPAFSSLTVGKALGQAQTRTPAPAGLVGPGGFAVRSEILGAPEDNVWKLTILHRNAPVVHAESVFLNPVETTRRENVPAPGCQTMEITAFTGGAHCCTTKYLAMQCRGRDLLQVVNLGDSEDMEFRDLDGDGVQELLVQDWSLAYYGPANADISLSFAESWPLARVLRFGEAGYEMDKAGQHAPYYQGIFKELAAQRTPDAGRALALLGAGLMARTPDRQLGDAFYAALPKAWKPHATAMLQDVERALADAALLETIPLP